MELHQIRYFLAIRDHGSFSRAAQDLAVSQPALTAAVKKLEQEIGGPLFHREGKRLVMTPLGRLVQPALEQVIVGTRSAQQIARDFRLLRQAPLRLGAMQTVGPRRLAAFLHHFHLRHPGVEVTVQDGPAPALLEQLEAGELDFAVLSGQPQQDTFRALSLYREPYVVICPAGHRLSRLDEVRLADVDGEAYVDRLSCEMREAVMALCTQREVRLYAAFRSVREEWVEAMVLAGLGFAFMPLHSVRSPQLQVRLLADPRVDREVTLVDVRGRLRSEAGRLFADEIQGYSWPADTDRHKARAGAAAS